MWELRDSGHQFFGWPLMNGDSGKVFSNSLESYPEKIATLNKFPIVQQDSPYFGADLIPLIYNPLSGDQIGAEEGIVGFEVNKPCFQPFSSLQLITNTNYLNWSIKHDLSFSASGFENQWDLWDLNNDTSFNLIDVYHNWTFDIKIDLMRPETAVQYILNVGVIPRQNPQIKTNAVDSLCFSMTPSTEKSIMFRVHFDEGAARNIRTALRNWTLVCYCPLDPNCEDTVGVRISTRFHKLERYSIAPTVQVAKQGLEDNPMSSLAAAAAMAGVNHFTGGAASKMVELASAAGGGSSDPPPIMAPITSDLQTEPEGTEGALQFQQPPDTNVSSTASGTVYETGSTPVEPSVVGVYDRNPLVSNVDGKVLKSFTSCINPHAEKQLTGFDNMTLTNLTNVPPTSYYEFEQTTSWQNLGAVMVRSSPFYDYINAFQFVGNMIVYMMIVPVGNQAVKMEMRRTLTDSAYANPNREISTAVSMTGGAYLTETFAIGPTDGVSNPGVEVAFTSTGAGTVQVAFKIMYKGKFYAQPYDTTFNKKFSTSVTPPSEDFVLLDFVNRVKKQGLQEFLDQGAVRTSLENSLTPGYINGFMPAMMIAQEIDHLTDMWDGPQHIATIHVLANESCLLTVDLGAVQPALHLNGSGGSVLTHRSNLVGVLERTTLIGGLLRAGVRARSGNFFISPSTYRKRVVNSNDGDSVNMDSHPYLYSSTNTGGRRFLNAPFVHRTRDPGNTPLMYHFFIENGVADSSFDFYLDLTPGSVIGSPDTYTGFINSNFAMTPEDVHNHNSMVDNLHDSMLNS
eukprot:GHVU01076277.1.p1 GENE.GHVU01076277.1~~GHVU01076277.1.p1  ORF type:complete len:836 (+),score=57.75 GHVU01076277.1:126-2510(+)